MTKYEKGMQGIVQDLKPPCRDRLDLLLHSKTLAVLAVDNESGMLHVDAPSPCLAFPVGRLMI